MKTSNVLNECKDVLKPKELLDILPIGRNKLYKCLADGTIKSVRVGDSYLIPKLYVIEFLYGEQVVNFDDDDLQEETEEK